MTSAGVKVKQFGMLNKASTPVASPASLAADSLTNSVAKLKSSYSPSPGNALDTQRSSSSLIGRSFKVETEPALRVIHMKDELLEEIADLGKKLPANTLDQLIDQLGGPDKVAEV